MSEQTPKNRGSKFKRQPERNKFVFQKRDLGILKLVYEYRFITSDQITALIPGSPQLILRRLQKLFHNGYLDRLNDPRLRIMAGSEKMVYAITKKAGYLLASEAGIDIAKIDWDTKNIGTKEYYKKHVLMISKFRAALTLACQGENGIELFKWVENRGSGNSANQEISDKVWIEPKDGKKFRLPVIPDAFFILQEDDERMFFFLEADRGTMSGNRFYNKLLAYKQWYAAGGFEKKFNIKDLGFRVLTVTTTNKRRDNLKAIGAEVGLKGMFWFTAEDHYSIDNPESIFSPIWLTAKDDKMRSLLE